MKDKLITIQTKLLLTNIKMDKNYKKFIDAGINELTKNEIEFKITSIAIIDMMRNDEDLKGELTFYWRIVEALINKEDNISYEEKIQFLAMHTASIEVYKKYLN